jgi:hypothetical protein
MLCRLVDGVERRELSLHRDTASQPPQRLFQKESQHPLQRKGVSMGDTQQRSRRSSYTGRLQWASGMSLVPSWTQRTRGLWLNLRLDARCQQTSQLVFLLGDQAIIDDRQSSLRLGSCRETLSFAPLLTRRTFLRQ